MRLVCPNCGAQYEIDDRVIPDAGRDVQCSSCGHAWYQKPANAEQADEAAPVDTTDVTEADEAIGSADADLEPEDTVSAETSEADDAPEPAPEPEPEPEPEAAVPAPDDEDDDEDDDAPLAAGAEGVTPPRRELDDSLRAILQEERAREMAARATDGGADMLAGTEAASVAEAVATSGTDAPEETESPDTGTEPETETETATEKRDEGYAAFGPIPGDDGSDDNLLAGSGAAGLSGAVADKASRGRDLFPDIEEINSTLDSHGTEEAYVEEPEEERRSGFGRAFFAIIFIAALALALYLVAPKLAESIPALEPALAGYVDAVNGARAWLEGLLQGVTDQIDGAAE